MPLCRLPLTATLGALSVLNLPLRGTAKSWQTWLPTERLSTPCHCTACRESSAWLDCDIANMPHQALAVLLRTCRLHAPCSIDCCYSNWQQHWQQHNAASHPFIRPRLRHRSKCAAQHTACPAPVCTPSHSHGKVEARTAGHPETVCDNNSCLCQCSIASTQNSGMEHHKQQTTQSCRALASHLPVTNKVDAAAGCKLQATHTAESSF